jgi:hypothetical protein
MVHVSAGQLLRTRRGRSGCVDFPAPAELSTLSLNSLDLSARSSTNCFNPGIAPWLRRSDYPQIPGSGTTVLELPPRCPHPFKPQEAEVSYCIRGELRCSEHPQSGKPDARTLPIGRLSVLVSKVARNENDGNAETLGEDASY